MNNNNDPFLLINSITQHKPSETVEYDSRRAIKTSYIAHRLDDVYAIWVRFGHVELSIKTKEFHYSGLVVGMDDGHIKIETQAGIATIDRANILDLKIG